MKTLTFLIYMEKLWAEFMFACSVSKPSALFIYGRNRDTPVLTYNELVNIFRVELLYR